MRTNKTTKSRTDLKYSALEAFIKKNHDACDQNAEISKMKSNIKSLEVRTDENNKKLD